MSDLDQKRLASACGLNGKAWRVWVYRELGSTQEGILRLAVAGMDEGAVIFAEHQSAGRGQFDRKWCSAPGLGLTFSLLLRPQWPVIQWMCLTSWIVQLVQQVLNREEGIQVHVKVPNDLMLQNRKLAGILTETRVGARIEKRGVLKDVQGDFQADLQDQEDGNGSFSKKLSTFAIVGIGMNVNQELCDFPVELHTVATSLRIVTGRVWNRERLAIQILQAIGEQYDPQVAPVLSQPDLPG